MPRDIPEPDLFDARSDLPPLPDECPLYDHDDDRAFDDARDLELEQREFSAIHGEAERR